MKASRAVVVSGIGETEYVRGTDKSTLQLLLQASLAACADAGIDSHEIDGLITPNSATTEDFVMGLGIRDLRFTSSVHMGGASAAAAVALAARAVSSGIAHRVLVPVGRAQFSSGGRLGSVQGGAPTYHWPGNHIRRNIEHPFGISVPMHWYSLHANRWLYETGSDPTGMRTVALSARAHAHRNPKAYFGGRSLTAEMYDAAPLLARPFRLYDISQESDGAAAVLVERSATEISGRQSHVYVAGGGEGHPDSPDDIASRRDVLDMGISKAAPRVLKELGLSPEEFDFAELYDCFTFIVLRQLEEIGFCARGEANAFVEQTGIGPGGALPVNTHGGLLSQAHIIGMNHLVEAAKQLRNEAGEAQVIGAHLGLVTGYGNFGDGSLVVMHN